MLRVINDSVVAMRSVLPGDMSLPAAWNDMQSFMLCVILCSDVGYICACAILVSIEIKTLFLVVYVVG